MCIILTCEPSARPSYDVLETCWTFNPDGGGAAWVEGGKVQISKGYTTLEDFAALVESIPAASPAILHMRIGTSGGLGRDVTHPFPVARSLDLLHALDVECPVAIAHNGVLPYPSDNKAHVSDTIAYVMQEVFPLAKDRRVRKHGGLALSKYAKKELAATSKGSRLALLDAAGHIRRVGEGWVSVCAGVQASNSSFRPYSYGFSWQDWRDDADEWSDYEGFVRDEIMAESGCMMENCACYCDCCKGKPYCDFVAQALEFEGLTWDA